MSASRGRPPAEDADIEVAFQAVPDGTLAELIDGEVVVSPRADPIQSAFAVAVMSQLGAPFRLGRGGPGGWVFLFEPEIHLGDQELVPDLAGWRRSRLLYAPEEGSIDVAPDWACEILSAYTAREDRGRKRRIYADHGVEHLWLADPASRMLEIYRLRDHRWLLIETLSDETAVRVAPFEAVALDAALLWDW